MVSDRSPAAGIRCGRGWSLWMVGRWLPLHLDTWGQALAGSRPSRRDRAKGILLLRGACHSPGWVHTPMGSAADRPLGNSAGATGWPRAPDAWALSALMSRAPGRAVRRSDLTTTPPPPVSTGGGRPRGALRGPSAGFRIVTWLILPVVICLSQRLSHACLSISNLYGETANGSLNQLSFI